MNTLFSKNRSGITIIEVLVVMALFGMVISVVYSLFFFGNNVFSMSSSQYDIQSEVRFAMDTIIKEVRYATYLEIINADEARDFDKYEEGFNYFYIDDEKLYHITYDKELNEYDTVVYDGHFDDELSLFSRLNTTTFGIKISSKYRGQSYDVETEVELLNLNNENSINGTNAVGLKYSKHSNDI